MPRVPALSGPPPLAEVLVALRTTHSKCDCRLRTLVESVQGGPGCVVEDFGFGVLFAETVDGGCGGHGHEAFVVELAFGGETPIRRL